MLKTREDGDEDAWVLLFTTAIEEEGDEHRYLVFPFPFSFKMKVEGRLTILSWSRKKIDSSMMALMVTCKSLTTKVNHGQPSQSRSTIVNQGQ
jgi:hypothetical protein